MLLYYAMIILSINIGTTNARAQRTKFVFRKRNYRTHRISCIYTPQQCNLKRAQFLHNNTLADIIRAINHLIISCVYIIIVRPWSRSIVFFSAVGNSEKKNNGRTHLIDIHVVIIIIIFFFEACTRSTKNKK